MADYGEVKWSRTDEGDEGVEEAQGPPAATTWAIEAHEVLTSLWKSPMTTQVGVGLHTLACRYCWGIGNQTQDWDSIKHKDSCVWLRASKLLESYDSGDDSREEEREDGWWLIQGREGPLWEAYEAAERLRSNNGDPVALTPYEFGLLKRICAKWLASNEGPTTDTDALARTLLKMRRVCLAWTTDQPIDIPVEEPTQNEVRDLGDYLTQKFGRALEDFPRLKVGMWVSPNRQIAQIDWEPENRRWVVVDQMGNHYTSTMMPNGMKASPDRQGWHIDIPIVQWPKGSEPEPPDRPFKGVPDDLLSGPESGHEASLRANEAQDIEQKLHEANLNLTGPFRVVRATIGVQGVFKTVWGVKDIRAPLERVSYSYPSTDEGFRQASHMAYVLNESLNRLETPDSEEDHKRAHESILTHMDEADQIQANTAEALDNLRQRVEILEADKAAKKAPFDHPFRSDRPSGDKRVEATRKTFWDSITTVVGNLARMDPFKYRGAATTTCRFCDCGVLGLHTIDCPWITARITMGYPKEGR